MRHFNFIEIGFILFIFNEMSFKVPNRHKTKEQSSEVTVPYRNHTKSGCRNAPANRQKVVHLKHLKGHSGLQGELPCDRRVTRGAVRAWQEGHKPWSDLPGLRLRFAESCTTSDYGTASESSYNCSSASGVSPRESCCCENMSGVDCLSLSEDEGVNNENTPPDPASFPMEKYGWNSENESESDDGVSAWDDHLQQVRVLFHAETKISAIIPLQCRKRKNLSSQLRIRVLKDEMYKPSCNVRMHHVSPVISMEPHGIQFRLDFPAYLSIPVNAEDERHLVCLCSNTQENEQPKWEKMPRKDYRFRDGFLILTVNHFSLFTVQLEEPYPESLKRIRRRMGGTLRVEEVPGVEIVFPRGCLDDDVDAYLRVLYDCETLKSDLLSKQALASPIIMIGPHGHQFDPSRPAVLVTLPVPDMKNICQRFNIPLNQAVSSLSVFQSPTMESEPIVWERLNTELFVNMNHPSGVPVVSFQVHHFSFFTVLWDILSTSLYEAKMGMANYYPYITFSMMCEAFMQETPNTNRFALEVICYRSDRRLPEMSNLQHRVGSSIKPKLVRPGRLLVRLKSQMFEADEDAGEEKDMAKEEPDFRGRDFEKQYACRFKPDVKQDLGAFGKVLVEKIRGTGRNDPVFEFNLYKTGHETEANLPERSERWTIVAIKELAANLQITEDNNWKKFAQHIGFTRTDPFMAMMSLYNQRGGTPEEFVQALFAVNRDIRMNMGKNTPPSSSSHGSVSPSHSGSSSFQQTTPRRPRRFPWFFGNKSPPQPTDAEMPEPKEQRRGQKRSHPSSGKNSSGKGKSTRPVKLRRKQFSDVSETVTGSSSGEAEDEAESDASSTGKQAASTKSSDLHRNNPHKLTDSDIWKVSSCMGAINWRALGRTLGIEESVLLNLEQGFKGFGVRECAYQMLLEWKGHKPRKCTLGALYTALCNEKMNSVAKQILQIKFEAQND
ncbi:hypothetical protein B566_EDAN009429 [Ephemera danica]|nr:hypothetical protein B566_EDAN009429 [Ephemera danica]